MDNLENLFAQNKAWSEAVHKESPDFFVTLSKQQSPRYLWIGCSDSRVPANEIVGLLPGELFVHRNVANVVVHTDLNCLSVLQYAVDVLGVTDIIVCGHYGCGGVAAAMQTRQYGLIDNWLRHLKDIYHKHETVLGAIDDPIDRTNRFCELNVIEQVYHVSHTTIVQGAWQRGQELNVHGWVYSISNGLLKDLNVCVSAASELKTLYQMAVGQAAG